MIAFPIETFSLILIQERAGKIRDEIWSKEMSCA